MMNHFEGHTIHECLEGERKRGLPYMTSAVGWGRGVPKKKSKGTKSADLWLWQLGEGVKKSENVVNIIYGSPQPHLWLGEEEEAAIGFWKEKREQYVNRFRSSSSAREDALHLQPKFTSKLLQHKSSRFWFAIKTIVYNFGPNFRYSIGVLGTFCDELTPW